MFSKRYDKHVLHSSILKGEVMKISSLGLFLTRHCNFRCRYCNAKTGTDPDDKMSLDELRDVVLQAKASGARRVIIPGEGEPFLDEHLLPLLDYISGIGLKAKVYTNGVLIDEYVAAYLFEREVAVVFKLHSLDRSIYDYLTGKNSASNWADYSYRHHGVSRNVQIPEGLGFLLKAGYHKKQVLPFAESLLEIEAVITRQNLNCIPMVGRFCRELGSVFAVETLIKTGRGKHNAPDLSVATDEESRLFDNLCKILGWKFRVRQKVRCCFETNPFLDSSGNICHCYSLAISGGNVRRASLAELHQKEMSLRKKAGMVSRKFSFWHHGFRCCASRKVINNEASS